MRPLWKDVLTAVWLGMILPGILLNGLVLKDRQQQIPPVPIRKKQLVVSDEKSIHVQDPDGTCISMELDAYLTGVLLAEMPAEFHKEALKAQSVAARTYCWKKYLTGGKHGDGSVCRDSACCQGYLAEETYLEKGGTQENLEKIRSAVTSTSGMVLAYDGELIEATYFSASGGSTESALAVWGTDYPYLQPVASPEPDLKEQTVCYTAEEFQQCFDRAFPESMDQWFGQVAYTDGGGVASMEICGEVYSGVQLRSILGLRSTAFQICREDDRIRITTRGYGHRVGMSQYGANVMGEAGYTWQQILLHYYPGATLVSIS